jgi:Mrp family chromosome partitioning ATPase/capsular polysaccharide biosynthesis protein
MTLRDYIGVIRQRWLIVLGTILVSTTAAGTYSYYRIPEYEATARVLVQSPGQARRPDEPAPAPPQKGEVLAEAEILRSESIAERVTQTLGLDIPVPKLLEAIAVVPVSETNVLAVTARSKDRAEAKALADAFSSAYLSLRRDRAVERAGEFAATISQRLTEARKRVHELDRGLAAGGKDSPASRDLETERDQLIARIASLQDQYDLLLDRSPLLEELGEIIELSSLPKEAADPNVAQNAALGLLMAIPIGIGLALFRDSLSDKIRTQDQAEGLTSAPTLALIPFDRQWKRAKRPRLAARDDPMSDVAEAFRALRVGLDAMNGHRPRSLMVTSPGRAEGKSATTANLGYAFAQACRDTSMISADLRNGRLHRFFNVPETPGLLDYLQPGSGEPPFRTLQPNLRIMSGGPSTERPDLWLGTPRSLQAVTDAAGDGLVLIDAPPILVAAEAVSIAGDVDAVVLVLFAGRTRHSEAAQAAERIRMAGGSLLGTILVGARPRASRAAP